MLTRLKLRAFRNLQPLDWLPAPGHHLLLGPNGAGKTSLLESIYALATTRSFRTSRLAQCLQHGEEAFHLRGEVEDARRWRLSLSWHRREGLSRAVDGSGTSLAEHLAVLPVVAWTSGDAETTTGEPALRRRFLDRGVVGLVSGGLERLSRYRRVLDEKRKLLSGEASGPLAPWNDLLAAAGAAVIEARGRYVEALRGQLAAVLDEVDAPLPALELRYKPSPRRGLDGEGALRGVLERVAERERAAGFVLVGPQRDDLDILWGGKLLKEVASAGERKAVSLLLIAAHGRVLEGEGRRPVYLLDDADAELAPGLLRRLWGAFARAEQLIASSNREAVWQEVNFDHRWRLEGGSAESW